jgi:hypothetical protein
MIPQEDLDLPLEELPIPSPIRTSRSASPSASMTAQLKDTNETLLTFIKK